MTEPSPISPDTLTAALRYHLPGRTILHIEDRGVWIRRNFKITLDGGEIIYLKLDQSFPASEKEAYICSLLQSNGLPAPRVLALDTSGSLLPAPFIIQAHTGGERLGDLLRRVDRRDQAEIYRVLARFYRKLHDIHHDYSGWIAGAGTVYPGSPAGHQFEQVIVRIGAEAVEMGYLSADTHTRLQRLWSENLPWLDRHTPSLVCGALHWTVFLAQLEGHWQVTKLTDLHDMLYWDPAWDLASLRYPVFRPPLPVDLWQVFAAEYGDTFEERRLRLYALLQHLDAAMGRYQEPADPEHERWKALEWRTFDDSVRKASEGVSL